MILYIKKKIRKSEILSKRQKKYRLKFQIRQKKFRIIKNGQNFLKPALYKSVTFSNLKGFRGPFASKYQWVAMSSFVKLAVQLYNFVTYY